MKWQSTIPFLSPNYYQSSFRHTGVQLRHRDRVDLVITFFSDEEHVGGHWLICRSSITRPPMISSGIFVGLLCCLHECFASPTICEVVLATMMIDLPQSTLCDDAPQHASLCDLKYTHITCNDHEGIQSIDLSGLGIYGEAMYDIEDICVSASNRLAMNMYLHQDDCLPLQLISHPLPSSH